MNNTRNEEFAFEIKEHIGVIASYATGWTKELNVIEWNGGNPKLDIRDWDPSHEKMSRGITLRLEEAKALAPILQGYLDRRAREASEQAQQEDEALSQDKKASKKS